jgi:hypothetical protein
VESLLLPPPSPGGGDRRRPGGARRRSLGRPFRASPPGVLPCSGRSSVGGRGAADRAAAAPWGGPTGGLRAILVSGQPGNRGAKVGSDRLAGELARQQGPRVHDRAMGEAGRGIGHVAGVPVAVAVVDRARVEGAGEREPVAEGGGDPVPELRREAMVVSVDQADADLGLLAGEAAVDHQVEMVTVEMCRERVDPTAEKCGAGLLGHRRLLKVCLPERPARASPPGDLLPPRPRA